MLKSNMEVVSQFSNLVNIRITYKNTPIHLLEKFAFKDLNKAYSNLLEIDGLQECIILQTCNRVEIFVIVDRNFDFIKIIKQWEISSKLTFDDFAKLVVVERGEKVIRHLLKLVSGLDSLVIGEDQIIGQVKRSFEFSKTNSYVQNNLPTIFEKAIRIGNKVRNLTGINKGSVSVGSVAVNLANNSVNNFPNKKILLIGSGEGASLVAKALKQRNIDFMNTSRTFERARSFADTNGGKPILFDDALESLYDMDVVFVSTTAPYYLLTYDRIKEIMSNRNKSLSIFDLSNPRTVEDTVSSISLVTLFNMDQIGQIVKNNIKSREKEIQLAEIIIKTEMENVANFLKRKHADPVVISVFRNVDKIRERELQKALSILGSSVGPRESKIIEQFSHALLEGIISTPMNNLRKQIQSDYNDDQDIMKIASKIFNYEHERSS
ncbi:MAG: glutamyl-tRNA reductase [Nitrososphaeraceae archaeon]